MRALLTLAAGLLAVCGFTQTGVLDVQTDAARTPRDAMAIADAAVRDFAKHAAALTSKPRRDLARASRFHEQIPFSLPTVVRLNRGGKPLSSPRPPDLAGTGITIAFDSTGSRVFPTDYQTLLQSVFNQAQGTINAVFGQPSWSGTVFVRNYDTDIQDRLAVSGGYFVFDNGLGQAEIRFPVYQSPEAAAVNFVHCLCLAYLGPSSYDFDAFQEGLVRAATMKIVRTAGALPATLDPQAVEFVLENTYDVVTFYDWFNQRALGGSRFIAPNLLNTQLPLGGSLGGIYLLRFQMSGSAWTKLLAENAAFIKTFNEQFYLNPTIGGDIPALKTLGQSVLDSLLGPGATVEGLSFAEWFRRQFILETNDTLGLKLLVQPIPLPPQPGTSDFGVFLVQATYFETRPGGDEILLSGVAYPIFWSDFFDRVFPSAQEDRMDIAGAYGSVAPNLPPLHGTEAYRTAIDIPVQDKIARTYVPAGAVATGANPTPNDFYGTLIGVAGGTGVTIRLRVTVGLTVTDNIMVTNGAFGFTFGTSEFLNGEKRVRVEVIRRLNSIDTVVIDRRVNKGPGPLALDLRLDNGETTFTAPGGLPKGLSTIGFPVDPFESLAGAVLKIQEDQVLAARWNAFRARHDIYPDCGPITIGNGYFVRADVAQPAYSVTGRYSPGVPTAAALRPGWNLVGTALDENVPTSQITVIKAVDFPKDYIDAVGVEIGTDFFEFVPGAPDAATGAPETGTMTASTSFQRGKAYYVRVLAPEGVTLLFRPSSSSLQTQRSDALAVPQPNKWVLKLGISQGEHRAFAFVGQADGATRGFDPRWDSGLPPAFSSGLQMATVGGTEPMYRDMRAWRWPERYTLKTSGLIRNNTYTITGNFAEGRLRRYIFIDFRTMQSRILTGAFTYTFRADAAERNFEIRVDQTSW